MIERLNQEAVSQATLMQAAYGSTQTKKGAQHFNKLIKRLSNG